MRNLVLCIALVITSQRVFSQNETQPTYQHQMPNALQQTINIGPCRIVLNGQCPDPDVTFFMYSTAHPDNPEPIYTATNTRGTNLGKTSFDPAKPSKVIIHGYNSNMFLSALTKVRKEYLKTNDYNIFVVDWSPLNQSPCYVGAVWNARHVGTCIAQLVDRIRDMGAVDIHVIGFSLGAHITNYLSLALRPYVLPRITGLDPALPGYITTNLDEKLDKTDAAFVDVYHTNAFMQGKAEASGHVDFYFNGGSIQPGCWGSDNFFSCNHHRAPIYYAESINSAVGFWGWRCISLFDYLTVGCPVNEFQIPLGEAVSKEASGTYMVITASTSPFAIGPYNVTSTFTKRKFTKPVVQPDNTLGASHQNDPAWLLMNNYFQEVVDPSTAEAHELFEDVLQSSAAVSNQIFEDDLSVFRRSGRDLKNNRLE